MKIYVPEYSEAIYPCVRITSGTLRAYHSMPQSNRTVQYTDFYLQNHYMSVNGEQTFSNNVSVVCENPNNLTDEYWYRLDIADTLIAFMIIVVLTLYIPFKMYERIFRRR